MTVAAVAPWNCEGCGEPLPSTSRSNRRYHDATCAARARRRRRREELDKQFAADQDAAALRAAVARATTEDRLLGNLAKAAASGSVRANVFLIGYLYGSGRSAEDELRQGDELAAWRQRHRVPR
jgi:hypothetical protein